MKTCVEKLNQFVIKAISSPGNVNEFTIIGEVSQNTIDIINEKYRIDLRGFKHIIDFSSIRHIWQRHGPQSNDRTPIEYSDFIFIPFILSNPDVVKQAQETGPNGEMRFIFEKKLPGECFYVTIQEVRRGHKSVSCVSLRKRKTR